jgi:phosphoribosyl-dephospho-CoA transferase
MSGASFRRHDLIWLDPQIGAQRFTTDGQTSVVRDWARQRLPFVVTRQSGPVSENANQISLGLTLPSAPARTRVALCADRGAIIRHTRPLSLFDAMPHVPAGWRASLELVLLLAEKTRTAVRVYGSLSSQIFTGNSYLDAASDLDLLLECNADTNLHDLLGGLEDMPASGPRIDGEVMSQNGWAVAWRELAAALRTGMPRRVLAKSDCEVRLLDVDAFIQPVMAAA